MIASRSTTKTNWQSKLPQPLWQTNFDLLTFTCWISAKEFRQPEYQGTDDSTQQDRCYWLACPALSPTTGHFKTPNIWTPTSSWLLISKKWPSAWKILYSSWKVYSKPGNWCWMRSLIGFMQGGEDRRSAMLVRRVLIITAVYYLLAREISH